MHSLILITLDMSRIFLLYYAISLGGWAALHGYRAFS